MSIPNQFRIEKQTHQSTYLVNGELKTWEGKTSDVY